MMHARVVEVVEARNMTLVVFQLVAGEVAVGMTVGDSTSRWRVTGVSTVQADAWLAGRRGVSLLSLDGSAALAVGAELYELGADLG